MVFLIGLPPIIAAFRAIGNRRWWLTFAVSYLLPLPVLAVLLVGSHYLFEGSVLGTRYGSFFGIYLPVLVTDLVAAALFILLAPRYSHPLVKQYKLGIDSPIYFLYTH